MTKAEKVKLLLLSMDSHLPDPKPPRVYASAEPGPQASYYVPCESCWRGRTIGGKPCHICRSYHEGVEKAGRDLERRMKSGEIESVEGKTFRMFNPNHGCSRCLVCGDTPGQRRVNRRERNFDPYSGKTMEELAELPAVEPPRKRVGATLSSSQPSERDFPWVEERKRMEAYGSYKELREALEWLRDRHLPRFEMLSHWVSSRDDRFWSWSEEAETAVNTTIEMLAERMPYPVRYPGWLRKELAA